MLKDITIGQFYPADSIIHQLDARIKIIATLVFVIMLFVIDSFVGRMRHYRELTDKNKHWNNQI